MQLTVRCSDRQCSEYDRAKVIDVGRVGNLSGPDNSNIRCPACGNLMRIVVPNPSPIRGRKRPRPVS